MNNFLMLFIFQELVQEPHAPAQTPVCFVGAAPAPGFQKHAAPAP